MENSKLSSTMPKPAPKILPQKYLKFMAFIHYYNQHLVDNNISTREDLDEISKLWSPMDQQLSFVDSFLDSECCKEFKKITSKKKAEKMKKQRDKEKNEKKEIIKKGNQIERYITREYKSLTKELKKNPHKRFTYSAEHGTQIFEKMPHLSDLRDELKEQKDEGLMMYIKEHIIVNEDEICKKKDKKPLGRQYMKFGKKITGYQALQDIYFVINIYMSSDNDKNIKQMIIEFIDTHCTSTQNKNIKSFNSCKKQFFLANRGVVDDTKGVSKEETEKFMKVSSITEKIYNYSQENQINGKKWDDFKDLQLKDKFFQEIREELKKTPSTSIQKHTRNINSENFFQKQFKTCYG